jgi:hypothetical protein
MRYKEVLDELLQNHLVEKQNDAPTVISLNMPSNTLYAMVDTCIRQNVDF